MRAIRVSPLRRGKKVAVEVNPARVQAAAARVSIRVQLLDDPEIDVDRPDEVDQPLGHGEARALVAVDAADDQNALRCGGIPDPPDPDRPALGRAAELPNSVEVRDFAGARRQPDARDDLPRRFEPSGGGAPAHRHERLEGVAAQAEADRVADEALEARLAAQARRRGLPGRTRSAPPPAVIRHEHAYLAAGRLPEAVEPPFGS